MIDATLVTASWRFPELAYNMIETFRAANPDLADVEPLVYENDGCERSVQFFSERGINVVPHDDARLHDHAAAVRHALDNVTTRYMILADTDVEFRAPIGPLFDLFKSNAVIVGRYVPEIERDHKGRHEIIVERYDPCFCLFDVSKARKHGLYFNSDCRQHPDDAEHPALRDGEEFVRYDVGSQFVEQMKDANLRGVDVDIRKYIIHYTACSRKPHTGEAKKLLKRARARVSVQS